jgi:hypothetical protein
MDRMDRKRGCTRLRSYQLPAGRWLLLCRAGDYRELDSALLNVKTRHWPGSPWKKWTGLLPARQSSDSGRFWRGRPPLKSRFLRRDWWSGFTVLPDFIRSSENGPIQFLTVDRRSELWLRTVCQLRWELLGAGTCRLCMLLDRQLPFDRAKTMLYRPLKNLFWP